MKPINVKLKTLSSLLQNNIFVFFITVFRLQVTHETLHAWTQVVWTKFLVACQSEIIFFYTTVVARLIEENKKQHFYGLNQHMTGIGTHCT